MIYGYARVSTKLQKTKGFSLEEQKVQLLSEGCEKIYIDTYTGKTANRPEMEKLRSVIKSGDTLVCTKLDRFCRSVIEGQKLAEELLAKGVTVKILNLGTIEDTTMGRFMLQMLLAVAELERSLIVERTREGKDIAKTRPDYKEGRPRIPEAKLKAAVGMLKDHTVKEVCGMMGIGRTTLIRARKKYEQASRVTEY